LILQEEERYMRPEYWIGIMAMVGAVVGIVIGLLVPTLDIFITTIVCATAGAVLAFVRYGSGNRPH
jgi:uncharacterized membrane protein YhaH (DUF805 family)